MKESYQSPEGRPTALPASLIASGTALTDSIGMDLGADSLERACVNWHHKRAALSSLGRGIASTRDSVVDDLVVIAEATENKNATGRRKGRTSVGVARNSVATYLGRSSTRDLDAVLGNNRCKKSIPSGTIHRIPSNVGGRTRAVDGDAILLISGNRSVRDGSVANEVFDEEGTKVRSRPVSATNPNAVTELAAIQSRVAVSNISDLIATERSRTIGNHQHARLLIGAASIARQHPGNGQVGDRSVRARAPNNDNRLWNKQIIGSELRRQARERGSWKRMRRLDSCPTVARQRDRPGDNYLFGERCGAAEIDGIARVGCIHRDLYRGEAWRCAASIGACELAYK